MLLLTPTSTSANLGYDAEEAIPNVPVTNERLMAHARDLAALHGRPGVGGHNRLLRWLNENASHLDQAIDELAVGMRAGRRLPPAALWLLDNRQLIRTQITTVRRHLPRSYSRRLPLLRQGAVAGLPRVLVLARDYIAHVDGRLEQESLLGFIGAYQETHALLLSELWATPIMLRLGLIGNLARLGRRVAQMNRDTISAGQWAERLIATADERSAELVVEVGRLSAAMPDPSVAFIAELRRLLRGHSAVQSVIGGWLDARRDARDARHDRDDDLRHSQAQASDQLTAEITITSLRQLDEADWLTFVESASVVEAELGRDPAGIHQQMDEATRDAYRHAVESLARHSGREEHVVAQVAVRLAQAGNDDAGHTGHWLLGSGRQQLERELGLARSLPCLFARWYRQHGELPFIAAVVLLSLAGGATLLALTMPVSWSWWMLPLLGAITVTAASQPLVHLLAWLHARLLTPTRLPRLDFTNGIGESCRTLVVVPTMLRRAEDGAALAEGLELRWLANRDPALRFALVTDFADAPTQEIPGDAEALAGARGAVAALNARHGHDGSGPFLLLHRPRRHNPVEGCWMGWERKRGKLEHLNALLRRGERQHFSVIDGDEVALQGIRYVIVLDTDTQLPPGAARRLVATMAHPLMHPHHDRNNVVSAGHALLQPKVAISSASAVGSRFARLSAPEPGIDAYSGVSADLWQDLCDQGSFVGKGIYDVVAFDRALSGRFPADTILSHDLIEGCYARAGLVSDVALVEDQPASLLADRARRHRWMRGDWQIAAWLMPWVRDGAGRMVRNHLSLLARWKILDNLRRALVPPAVLALVVIDLCLGSGGLACAALGILWLVTPIIAGGLATPRRADHIRWRVHLNGVGRRFVSELAGLGLTLVMLPAEALLSLHALVVALWRTHVSGKKRLAWMTSSDAERLAHSDVLGIYRSLWSCPFAGLALLTALPVVAPATQVVMVLFAGAWLVAPLIAWWLSRPLKPAITRLSGADRDLVALIARTTWRWFETFVTESEHWLPPDNVQEQPVALIAHRTSPTNIGMALLADLAANDLGYLPTNTLIERCGRTLDTLERLERHRGHFFNWYDTHTLLPLSPRYVSTVDSGNLVGALLVLTQGLQALERQQADPTRVIDGLRTTAAVLATACDAYPQAHGVVADLRHRLMDMSSVMPVAARLTVLAEWAAAQEPALQGAGDDAVWWLRALIRQAHGWAAFHRDMGWDVEHPTTLLAGGDAARRVVEQAHRLAHRATALADAMDFRPLYHQRRRLFAIGMQAEESRVDRSCYDLLASEARLTSYLAVARGHAPLEHWFALGRPLVDVDGRAALVSWSGSMFEYLMPDLLMPEFPDTLLATGQRAMLTRQIQYGQSNHIPWGVSESGYHLTDAAQQWQYRGFGVPGLGLKHGLGDDLVVAPYASALALLIDPAAAVANLQRLRSDGMFARHGFYEAVDYTPSRLPPGTKRAVVRSWMAHHQGMTLLACVHVLADAPMRARFRADPHLRALELLLQERAPQQAPFVEAEEESRPLTPAEEAAGAYVVANPNSTHPEATLLSNGRYHVLITAGGAGVSRWRGLSLNRWQEDPLNEEHGLFCWLHDVERGHRWSVTHQPAQTPSRAYETVFTQAKAEFRRRDHDIDCTCEIAIASVDDVELRRITLVNRSGIPRTIEVTTGGEVVVGSGAADIAHQAFSGLGLTTRFDQENGALFCHRRPRRGDEAVPVALHLMTVHGAEHSPASVETDRVRFVGRGRTIRAPAALDRAGPLGGCVRQPLDAVMAMRRRVQLPPDVPVVIDVVWGFADDANAAITVMQRYRERALTDRVSGLAWAQSRLLLHQLGVDEETAQAAARLVAALATVSNAWRAPAGVAALNRRSQSALWAHGISGDLPILLLRIADVADLEVARDCLGAHAWWRAKGLPVDVVLWNDDPTAYRQDLHERLTTLVEQTRPLDGRPGTVVLRHADQLNDDDRIALFTAARVVLDAAHGPFLTQASRRPRPARVMELLQPPRAPRSRAMAPAPIPAGLSFLNGMGGFDPDGAYVVVLDPGATTPAPWINVLANEQFGALISASGASCTWDSNCHEFRLTPWPTDAVGERCGEALYLRDEEDGGFWSPSQWPAAAPARYVARHSQGITSFTCHHDDLVSEMSTFVAVKEPVRVWRWRITNRGERMRRLSATWCGELVLGEQRRREAPFIITARDPLTGALVARNPHHPDLARRSVALDVNLRTRQVSGDRAAVLGRNRGWDRPEVMQRSALDGRTGAALDPCLAIQAPFDLAPGQMREVVFVLACGDGMEAAALAARWCMPGVAGSGQAEVAAHWRGLCDGVQIATPDRALDLLVNRWLPYQTIACRLWARGAWYQSGGAIGFRDQLQDAMGLVHLDAGLLRRQIVLAASRQFVQGDVQHWWHPPAGRGVRTRCSDDLLWLPAAVVRYIEATGDRALLDQEIGFLAADRELPAEGDLYEQPLDSGERASLYEHCLRAIRRARSLGAHGLPLIGSGDWNDGFDRLGHHGRGESVWLAFFLHHVIAGFLPIMRARGHQGIADELATWNGELLRSADAAWDGAWYRRAYDDEGRPIGSAANAVCRIDSLPQSWAVIAGAPDLERMRVAMDQVDRQLIDRENGVVRLFHPAFGEHDGDPGYIRGYPEGVRENGGQYTHAAVWVAMAFARLGDAKRAWEVVRLLDPIRRGADPRRLAKHRTEPYVLCGDVYTEEPWAGRGGWSWYTGSAGWLYRTLVEELLGLQLVEGQLVIAPLLPEDWPGFTATYRRGTTTWTIAITRGDERTVVDGAVLADHRLPLIDDGGSHRVEAVRSGRGKT